MKLIQRYLNNGVSLSDPVILRRAKQVYNVDVFLGIIAPILIWFFVLADSGIYKAYFIPLLAFISCLSLFFVFLISRGWYIVCAAVNTLFYLFLPLAWIGIVGVVINAFYLISLSLNGFIYFPHRRRWGVAIFATFFLVAFLMSFFTVEIAETADIQEANSVVFWFFMRLFLVVLVFRISTLLILYWNVLAERDKEEERYRSIFENNLIGMVATRGDQIIEVNQALCLMLGYTKAEMYKLKPADVVLPYNHEVYMEKAAAMFQQQITGFTIKKAFRKKDGEPLYCLLSVKCFYQPNGEPDYVISSIMDRTESKAQDDLIASTMEELDQRNQDLKRYIESNMQLENFAYIASHDLKSPLRTIISFAQLLKRSLKEKLSKQEYDFLQYIISGAENMNKLVGDLLMYSRVDTEKEDFTLINLQQILDSIQNDLNIDLKEKNVSLEIGALPSDLVGDETKIRQLFQNLIANAIKFQRTDIDSFIRIVAEEKADCWSFQIVDNGIGIKEEFFEKIFLLFRKLHTSDEYKGTGIGLALCKKIVEQHGGEIGVSSTYGEGTTFYFELKKVPVLAQAV
ncbi:MAG: ATP-binding protein [Bacteroidota bacterium]